MSSVRSPAGRSRRRCWGFSAVRSSPGRTCSSSASRICAGPSTDCRLLERGTGQTVANENGNGDVPRSPTDLERRDWGKVLKRTVKEFRQDNLTDWAAALTYYSVLALFPALIALVS